ncbi:MULTISPECIES: DsbA family protein [unclassified Acidovorax]|uniref:DsbA family protein n=1 Tax=unclassified Acidovorax TaxID=2684926 RepID=UPI002882ECC5|nr:MULTISPECIES: DsbA family protein [unclassified Acidovorax]
MKSKLLYVTDAYCCWCYGFSKTMAMVSQEFGDRLDIQVVNGGMIPRDLPLQTLFSSFADPVALHARISSMSGQVFGEAYLDQLRALSRSSRVVNSLVPACAMQAMKSLTDASDLQIFTEFQHAYYRDGMDLTSISTYRHLALMFDVDPDAFELAFEKQKSDSAVKGELALAKQLGVRGFPALLLQDGSGYTAVANGFADFKAVKSALDRNLSQQTHAGVAATASSCNIDGSGCS